MRSVSIPGYTIYRIPLTEPEQQQVRRVSRRIVGTQRMPVSDNSIEKYSTIVTPATVATSSTPATSSSTASSSSREISKDMDTNPSEEHLFNEIFNDVSEQPSWSIDTARFDIILAVPSRTTAKAVRVPKEVSEKEKFEIIEKEITPAEFSPVPAVPDTTAEQGTTAASAVSSASECLYLAWVTVCGNSVVTVIEFV